MFYNIPKTMFEWVGVRVFGNLQVNWWSYIIYHLTMITHTIYYWTKKGDFVYGTRCFCGMGIMILVIFFSIFFNKFNISKI